MGTVASCSDLKMVKMARVGPHLQQLAQKAVDKVKLVYKFI